MSLNEKRTQFMGLRFCRPGILEAVQKSNDIEITYKSNAIEGNTLTEIETAQIIEHGITIGGKLLKEHLEAVDHYDALLWMRGLASKNERLNENVVRDLHARIVARSEPAIAGRYSEYPRRIAGSSTIFPNAAKVPLLMMEFGKRLEKNNNDFNSAVDAHYSLVKIHPFQDGNGRTARLLMNLILIKGGYPPIAIGPAERMEYIKSLNSASDAEDMAPFTSFIAKYLERTLDQYIAVLEEGGEQPLPS